MDLDNTERKIVVPAVAKQLAVALAEMLGGAPGATPAAPVPTQPAPSLPPPEASAPAPIETIRIQIHPDGRMNAKNAALYLGKKEKTLAQWRSQGKGPRFVRSGGHIFYYQKDLDAQIR